MRAVFKLFDDGIKKTFQVFRHVNTTQETFATRFNNTPYTIPSRNATTTLKLEFTSDELYKLLFEQYNTRKKFDVVLENKVYYGCLILSLSGLAIGNPYNYELVCDYYEKENDLAFKTKKFLKQIDLE